MTENAPDSSMLGPTGKELVLDTETDPAMVATPLLRWGTSLFRSSFTLGPDSDQTEAEGPGLAPDDSSWKLAYFRVHCKTKAGLPWTEPGEELLVRVLGPPLPPPNNHLRERYPVMIQDLQNGTFHVSFYPEQGGTYNIHCKLNGRRIKNSPWEIRRHLPRLDLTGCQVAGIFAEEDPITLSVEYQDPQTQIQPEHLSVSICDPSGKRIPLKINRFEEYEGGSSARSSIEEPKRPQKPTENNSEEEDEEDEDGFSKSSFEEDSAAGSSSRSGNNQSDPKSTPSLEQLQQARVVKRKGFKVVAWPQTEGLYVVDVQAFGQSIAGCPYEVRVTKKIVILAEQVAKGVDVDLPAELSRVKVGFGWTLPPSSPGEKSLDLDVSCMISRFDKKVDHAFFIDKSSLDGAVQLTGAKGTLLASDEEQWLKLEKKTFKMLQSVDSKLSNWIAKKNKLLEETGGSLSRSSSSKNFGADEKSQDLGEEDTELLLTKYKLLPSIRKIRMKQRDLRKKGGFHRRSPSLSMSSFSLSLPSSSSLASISQAGSDADQEFVLVNLPELSPKYTDLVFSINIFDEGKTFQNVSGLYVRIVDDTTQKEIYRYDLSSCKKSAIIACKLFRWGPSLWKFRVFDDPAEGRTFQQICRFITSGGGDGPRRYLSEGPEWREFGVRIGRARRLQEGLLLRLGVRGVQGRVLYDRSLARTKLLDLPARPPDPDQNPPDSPGGGGPRILPYGGKIGLAEEAYRTRKAAQLEELRREHEEFHLPSEVEFEQQAPLKGRGNIIEVALWGINDAQDFVLIGRVYLYVDKLQLDGIPRWYNMHLHPKDSAETIDIGELQLSVVEYELEESAEQLETLYEEKEIQYEEDRSSDSKKKKRLKKLQKKLKGKKRGKKQRPQDQEELPQQPPSQSHTPKKLKIRPSASEQELHSHFAISSSTSHNAFTRQSPQLGPSASSDESSDDEPYVSTSEDESD